MIRIIARKLVLWLLVLSPAAWAGFSPFKIQDIQVVGLQQVEAGTVYRNFPLANGDLVTPESLRSATSQLFKSGFFDDIAISRDGELVILSVKERPAVSRIFLKGNEELKDDILMEGLENTGLKEGVVFKRNVLDRVTKSLMKLYESQGRYSTVVKADAWPLDGNRVGIDIHIEEGGIASIQQINFVGNEAFDDETLLEEFQLRLPSMWSSFTNSDRYAREKLAGDMERLKSYYMDRGYLKVEIDSPQVSISPDRRFIYITISLVEGERYYVDKVSFQGELVATEVELRELVPLKPGDVFSRKAMVNGKDSVTRRVGDDGYMFARVATIPEVKEGNKVDLTYMINPGKRVYVRRINVKGNSKTSDAVVRRELRQMESAPASNAKIETSKVRLQRLGYFGSVDVETQPVPGRDDQVDLDFSITEQQSGSFTASVGVNGSDGVTLGLGLSQKNFLGSGRDIAFEISNSDTETIYNFSVDEPYYTIDGISRGIDFYYKTVDFDDSYLSAYGTDTLGAGMTFGYPLSESQRISFGSTVEQLKVKTAAQTPNEVFDFISNEGDSYTNLILQLGWSDSALNRGYFPTSGYSQSVSLEAGVPLGDLSYYKSKYSVKGYFPVDNDERWVLTGWSRLGYASSMGENEYPFFKNFYAGGMRSVRGYQSSSLGPQGSPSNGDAPVAMGGNVLVTGGVELIFPLFEDSTQWRTLAFVDGGNVFDTSCPVSSTTCEEGIDFGEIRYATGLAMSWLTAVGPLTFIFSKPLNARDGDETEFFQFSFGQSF